MTSNRRARRQANKITRKAINAYALGGCPFCGSPPEDYARYPIGMDLMRQTIACCEDCSDGRLVTISGYGVKIPDEQGTQWSLHDRAFFELHLNRQLHVREPWKQEAELLAKMTGMVEVDVPLIAVLVVQFKPGMRGRMLWPFPAPGETDEAGDEAIAAQTGRSVTELLATARSTIGDFPSRGSMQSELKIGLAWTKQFEKSSFRAGS